MSTKLRRATLHALQQNFSALPRAISECTHCGTVELTPEEESAFLCDTCTKHVAK